jgi:aarF domain-containing kinase
MYIHGSLVFADLHPGNVLVSLRGDHALPSSSRASNSKTIDVTFIDTGLVASLEPNDRRNFIDLFSAVVKNDGYRVGQLMVERSRGGVDGVRNPEAFYKELESIVSEVHDAGLSLKRISVGDILQRVLVACYVNQVKLEPKFVSVAIAIGVVEGLGRRLDPNVDILKIATPFILKAALKS